MASFIRFLLIRMGVLARFFGSRVGVRVLLGATAAGTGNNLGNISNLWNVDHINTIGVIPYALSLLMVALDIWTIIWIAKIIVRYYHDRKLAEKLVHMRITLPKNDSKLDNEKRTEKDFREIIGRMEQLFRSLHETRDLGLYNIVMKRWLWKRPQISFELQFENQEMSFVVICEPYYEKLIQKQITTFYESAEVEYIKPEEQFNFNGLKFNGFHAYIAKEFWYPINTYKKVEDDPLNGLANSFAKLARHEKAAIQIVAHPKNPKWQKKAKEVGTMLFKGKKPPTGFHIPIIGPILSALLFPFRLLWRGYDPEVDKLGNGNKQGGDPLVRMLQAEEEIYKSIGEKSTQTGFECVVRIMAGASDEQRVQDILNGIFLAFNIFKSKGANRFEYTRLLFINAINCKMMWHNFRLRLHNFFWERESLLVAEELASIFHFPDAKYNKIPTIKWLTYKVLPAPLVLPTEGPVLGKNIYRGVEKEIRFNRSDRTRHTYIIGKSGSGKSVLLWNMARQDVANGEGVCVIDPHGDLVEDIAASCPKERAKEVIFFNPGDVERPMGLNILEASGSEQKERAALDAMEIFIKLFGNEIFGPRIQHYFRNGCLTLMDDDDEGATLIDIPRLFIDDEFQKYKVSKVKNVVVKAFWDNEMANTGEREKQEMIPYFTSKFGPFVTNTTMRNIIGQTKSAFNFRECMDSQKVLLINLSKGRIGGINAQLLGLIAVSKINQAAMARADMAPEDRKDLYFYVDEFQNFATDTFAAILSEARKYRLNLIMAHQYIAQLTEGGGMGPKDDKIKNAVFGNVGSMMSFKVGAEDAEYLEKEYAPLLSAQDILSMANYKAYVKLNVNNTTSRPFSMQTLYDPSVKNPKMLEIIQKYSRIKYGRAKEFVDQEIEARMGIDTINKVAEAAAADPHVDVNALQTPHEAQQKAVATE
ncbi:hypothetical protein CSB37_00710 [bacterium DOLZORAL124_38_8]|nr:MAG: hypothetical protein CSB37_00710 [bacterium DOLZORAL124_38_8]